MGTLQIILIFAVLIIWIFISIGFLISIAQGIVNDRKHELRDIEREKRDLEYHEKRMKEFQ